MPNVQSVTLMFSKPSDFSAYAGKHTETLWFTISAAVNQTD
jgi:hypothetical protein